jgi:DNA-binding beta-propeller fold protein YncE
MNDTATMDLAKSNKRKKRLKIAFWLLAMLFLALLAALAYYLLTQRTVVQDIPGSGADAPRFVKSVFGDFTDLTGVAVNKKGDKFYVCDTQAQKVWMISKDGAVLGSFGKPGNPTDEEGFGTPYSVAVGVKDQVYVADRLGARVQIYSPIGKYIGQFRPTEAIEWSPIGIASDTTGNIYVSDAKKDEHRVLKFDKNGKLLLKFGKQGLKNGEFNFPNALAVAANGDIYVCDSNNARVQVFNSKGKFKRAISGTGVGALTHPTGISLTRQDEIIVVESFGHDVQAYDTEGNNTYNFGKFGITDGQFRYPKGIAIAPDGTAFISDGDNKRIQVWKY